MENALPGSCKALCFAPILLVIGIWILVSNEGNLVAQRMALEEGLQSVTNIPIIDTIDPNNEGKLIHVIGQATTTDQISDTIFGVSSADNAWQSTSSTTAVSTRLRITSGSSISHTKQG